MSPINPVEFPNLYPTGFVISSVQTPQYNCIAWAAHDDQVWWWPDTMNLYYWPPNAPRKATIDAFIIAFESMGYFECDNPNLEAGFEKIAFFRDNNGTPTHAARLLDDGRWASKMGQLEDIEHNVLEGVNGPIYGSPCVFMKRQKIEN